MELTFMALGLAAIAAIAAALAVRARRKKAQRSATASRSSGFEAANYTSGDGSPRLYTPGISTRVYSVGTQGYGKGHCPPGEPPSKPIFATSVVLADAMPDDAQRRDSAGE